jgi:hypothetical protein
MMNIQTTKMLLIFCGVHLELPFCGEIAERNKMTRFAYSSRLCLFNLTVTSGNGNKVFTQKLHVQLANSHPSQQSQTKIQPWPSF